MLSELSNVPWETLENMKVPKKYTAVVKMMSNKKEVKRESMNFQHRILMLRTKLIKTPTDKESRISLIFNCLYTDVRRMGNKQAELELLIYEHKNSQVGVTDT